MKEGQRLLKFGTVYDSIGMTTKPGNRKYSLSLKVKNLDQ